MGDLVEFLRARLDEDAEVARAATEGPWSVDSETYAEAIYGPDRTAVVAGGRWGDEASVFETTEDAVHIARHDPARALREVEAKREIVNYESNGHLRGLHIDAWGIWRDQLKFLAQPYADHADYQQEWALASA